MKKFKLKYLLLVIAVICSMSVSYVAQSARGYNKSINIIAGKADTVELRGDVVDILVANPAIADVGTLRSDRLYIVGKIVGDTNILAYDDAGNQLANIQVHVRVDDKNIQDTLRSFFPDEDIKAKTVRNNIVLSGSVSSPSVSNQIRDLASRFLTEQSQTLVDLMTVTGEHQVMLKVKVVEAKRAALRELGIDTSFGLDPITGAAPTNSGRGLSFSANDVGRSELTPFGAGTLLVGGSKGWGPISTTLRALESHGLINTLAEPNLTAISGETAGFLAGGEYPVPTGRDTQGNVIIEFKQFGVSLNFTPTVLSKDRIALHLSTEVSEKDPTNKVVLVDVEIDGLRVRRAETTVEVGSGQTIMMAGLIKSETLDSINGLPGAQDVPILGELFKSKSFKRNESELLIMVTPYLVKPYSEPEAVVEVVDPTVMQQQLEESFQRKSKKILDRKNNLAKKAEAKAKIEAEAKVEAEEQVSTKAVNKTKSRRHAKFLDKERKFAAKTSKLSKRYNTKVINKSTNKVIINSGEKASPDILTRSLMRDLKEIYGNRVPENISTDSSFGYIVD